MKNTTLKSSIKYDDLVYDIGLHKGQDTDYYLKKGFRVIAFEANPDNAEFCRKKFAEAIEKEKLIIIEGAITRKESILNEFGKVPFYRNSHSSFWGSTCKEWVQRNEVMGTENERIEVKAVNLAEYFEKYGIPFYLKADIVGSEKICLEALLEFEQKPDYISIRSEKLVFNKLLEEFALLQKLGYNRFKAVQQSITDWQTVLETSNGEKSIYVFEEGASGPLSEETGGKWKNYQQVLSEYRRIFVLYWLFGDYSFLTQTEKGKKFIYYLERIFNRSIPGWYDTHAKHSSLLSFLVPFFEYSSLI